MTEERKALLREKINSDSSVNGVYGIWLDLGNPCFYDYSREEQIYYIQSHFSNFTVEDINFILDEIMN